MSHEKENIKTEEEALEEEKREDEWQETYGKKVNFYIDRMNQLLVEKTRESRLQLRNMFANQEFFGHYRQVDIFATMYVVMSIYELEEADGISDTILEQGSTVEELLDYMFQFKTILYRLDFEIGQETEKELLSFLKEHTVSTIQLGVMMTTSVIRTLSMALKLEKIFEAYHMEAYLFSMLCFIEEHWSGNYRILCKLSALCKKSVMNEVAEEYMRGVPVISENLGAQEEVFAVQELLWKFTYKDTEAEELCLFIKKNKVSDEVWQFLMKHTEILEKEYYLRIVEVMLEQQMIEKAEIVLNKVLEMNPGDELILCLLAEVYASRGEVEKAEEYLKLISTPGELTQKLWKFCGNLKERK